MAEHGGPADSVSGQTTAMTGTSDTSLIAAQGAGVRTYVDTLSVVNNHATVATDVAIKDGATEKWRVRVAAGACVVVPFKTPLRGSANTAWQAANITTGSSVIVSAAGFKGSA
jgi:flavin-binding protein dodecin